ncbi:MAG: hypothetical protein ACREHD_11720 [Pirellulales bacterium]
MTSDVQREALAILAEIWSLSPDVRLGQLMSHLGFLGEVHAGRGLGYIDDDELMAVMNRHREELLSRRLSTFTNRQSPGIAARRREVSAG